MRLINNHKKFISILMVAAIMLTTINLDMIKKENIAYAENILGVDQPSDESLFLYKEGDATYQIELPGGIDRGTESANRYPINYQMLKYRHILVFGDYTKVSQSESKDKDEFGEWRYLGYTITGEPYSNKEFTNDADSHREPYQKNIIKLSRVRKDNDEYTYNSSIRALAIESLREVLEDEGFPEEWQDMSDEELLEYFLIQGLKGDGMQASVRMYHQVSNGNIWYQTLVKDYPLDPKAINKEVHADFNLLRQTTEFNKTGFEDLSSAVGTEIRYWHLTVKNVDTGKLVKEYESDNNVDETIETAEKELAKGLEAGEYNFYLYVDNQDTSDLKHDDESKNITVIKPDPGVALAIESGDNQAEINKSFNITAEKSVGSKGAKVIKWQHQISIGNTSDFQDISAENGGTDESFNYTYSSEGTLYFRVKVWDTNGIESTWSEPFQVEVKDGRTASVEARVDAEDPFYEGVFGWVRNKSRFTYKEDGEERTVSAGKAEEEGIGKSYWNWYREKNGDDVIDRHDKLNSDEYELGRGKKFERETGGQVVFDFVGEVYIEIDARGKGGRRDTARIKRPVLPTPHAAFRVSGERKENRRLTFTDESIYHRNYGRNYIKYTIKNLDTGEKGIITNTSNSTSGIIKNRDMAEDTVESVIKKAGNYEIEMLVRDERGHEDTVIQRITIRDDIPPVAKVKARSIMFRKPTVTNEEVTDESYSPDGDILNQRWWDYRYDSDNDSNFDEHSKTALGATYTQILSLTGVGYYRGEMRTKEDIDDTLPEFLADSDYLEDSTTWDFKVDNVRPVTSLEVGLSQDVDTDLFSDNNNLNYFQTNVGSLESGFLNNGEKLIDPNIQVEGIETSSDNLLKQFSVIQGIEPYYKGGKIKGNIYYYYTPTTRKYYLRNKNNSTIIKTFDNTIMIQDTLEDYLYFSDDIAIYKINEETLDITTYEYDFEGDVTVLLETNDKFYLKEYANDLVIYDKATNSIKNRYEGITATDVFSVDNNIYCLADLDASGMRYYKVTDESITLLYNSPSKKFETSYGDMKYHSKEATYVHDSEYIYIVHNYYYNYHKKNYNHHIFLTKVDLNGNVIFDKEVFTQTGSGLEFYYSNLRAIYKDNDNTIFVYSIKYKNSINRTMYFQKMNKTGSTIFKKGAGFYGTDYEQPITKEKSKKDIPVYTKDDGKYYATVDIGVRNSKTDQTYKHVINVFTGQEVYYLSSRARGEVIPTYGSNKYIAFWEYDDEDRDYDSVLFNILDVENNEIVYSQIGPVVDLIYISDNKAYIFGKEYNRRTETDKECTIVNLNTGNLEDSIYVSSADGSVNVTADDKGGHIIYLAYDEDDDESQIISYKINKGFYEITEKLEDFVIREGSNSYIPIVTKDNIESNSDKNTELINKANSLGAKIIFLGSGNNQALGQTLANGTSGTFMTYTTNANALAKIKDYIINDCSNELIKTNEIHIDVGEKFQINPVYQDYESDTLASTLYKLTNSSWSDNEAGWTTTYLDHFNTVGTRYLGIKQLDKPSNVSIINNDYAKWSSPFVLKIVVGDGETEPPEPTPLPPTVDVTVISSEGENIGKINRRVDFVITAATGTDDINWSSLNISFGKNDYFPKASEVPFNREFSRVFNTLGNRNITVTLKDTEGRTATVTKAFNIIDDTAPISSFNIAGTGKRNEQGTAAFNITDKSSSPDNDKIDSVNYYIEDINYVENADSSYSPSGLTWYPLELKGDEIELTKVGTNRIKQEVTENYTNGIGLNGEKLDDYRVFKSATAIKNVNVVNEAPTLGYNVAPSIIEKGQSVSHTTEISDDTPFGDTVQYKFTHDSSYYRNSDGADSDNNKVTENPKETLTKKGLYKFYAKATDEDGLSTPWVYGGTVKVVSEPVADFELYTANGQEYEDDFFKSGSLISIENKAYNEDYENTIASRGINYYKLEYRNVANNNWILIDERTLNNDDFYPTSFNFPSKIDDRGVYEVKMTVESPEGIEASVTKEFTMLELRMDAELEPSVIYASQSYKIKATATLDCEGVVALDHNGNWVTLSKTSEDSNNQYYEVEVTTLETLADGSYNIDVYGIYPFNNEIREELTLTVDTEINLTSDIKPIGPSEYTNVLEDNPNNNDYIKIPASEKIRVEADIVTPISISYVKAALEGETEILLSFNPSTNKYEGEITVPETKLDSVKIGKEHYKLNLKAQIANGNTAENNHRVKVETPIDLGVKRLSDLVSDSDMEIKASTTKYANSTRVKLYKDQSNKDTPYTVTENMVSSLQDNKKEWTVIHYVDPSIPEGDYLAEFTAKTPNGNIETALVPIKVINIKLENLRITKICDYNWQEYFEDTDGNPTALADEGIKVKDMPVYYNQEKEGIKLGYKVYFKIDSMGLDGDDDEIEITPKFYALNKNNILTEVDLYVEDDNSGDYKLIQNSEYRDISSYITLDGSNRNTSEAEPENLAKNTWMFKYYIPYTSKAVKKGKALDLYKDNTKKFKLLIVFNIVGRKSNGTEYNYTEKEINWAVDDGSGYGRNRPTKLDLTGYGQSHGEVFYYNLFETAFDDLKLNREW